MKKWVFGVLVVFFIQFSFASTYYNIDFNYVDDNLIYNSIVLIDMNFTDQKNSDDSYFAIIVDKDDLEIEKVSFVLPEYGGFFSVFIPFNSDGKEIIIKDAAMKKMFSIPITQFSYVCGDNICSALESSTLCPDDCTDENIQEMIDKTNKEKEDIRKELEKENQVMENEENFTKPTPEPDDKKSNLPVFKKKEEDKKSFSFSKNSLMIFFGIIFISLISTFVIITRNNKEKETKIKDIVTNFLKQGYNFIQIKDYLLKNNYNPRLVDHVLSETNNMLLKQQIKGYISSYIRQGYSYEKIKNYLLTNNYHPKIIDSAMEEVKVLLDTELKKIILSYLNKGYNLTQVKMYLSKQYDRLIVENAFSKINQR